MNGKQDVRALTTWRPRLIWPYYDLILLIELAVVMPALAILPVDAIRVPFGLAMVLFAPGYAMVATLFAESDDLGGIERAAISLGLSLAIISVLALILNILPWGLHPKPIMFSLAMWIIPWSGAAAVRRHRLIGEDAAALPPLVDAGAWWRAQSRPARTRLVAGGVGIVVMFGLTTALLLAPDPTSKLTEFYALNGQGQAEYYPISLVSGSEMQIQVGIDNKEGATQRYRAVVKDRDRQLAVVGPIELATGTTWQAPVRFTVTGADTDEHVILDLYRNDNPAPYRHLDLVVTVRRPAP